MKRIVILDRDGTLNSDPGYLNDPDKLFLFTDTIPALLRLKEFGFYLAVATNQSGVASGKISQLLAIHERLTSLLTEHGIELLDILSAPYLPTSHHYYRKPRPGMLQEILLVHNADPAQSWMIGDSESDMLAGRACGLNCIKVERQSRLTVISDSYRTAPDLLAAANIISEKSKS